MKFTLLPHDHYNNAISAMTKGIDEATLNYRLSRKRAGDEMYTPVLGPTPTALHIGMTKDIDEVTLNHRPSHKMAGNRTYTPSSGSVQHYSMSKDIREATLNYRLS